MWDFSSTGIPGVAFQSGRCQRRGLWGRPLCDAEGAEGSGKQAVKATASSTSHNARNPQLEWLRKDIALSKFMNCSGTLSENLRHGLTRKHYAPEITPRRSETATGRLPLCIPGSHARYRGAAALRSGAARKSPVQCAPTSSQPPRQFRETTSSRSY